MKKLAVSFMIGVFLIIIPSAFAIEEMTDAVMKSTTGQASVSVRIDNVVIEDLSFSMIYIDDDGIAGTPADAASIRMHRTYGTTTIRAIFDYTDRGGYLQREYGTLMRRELTNGGEPHWAGLATGGDRTFTEQTISTSKKLKLHSYMKAVNTGATVAGLAELKEAYDQLSSFGFAFSEANSAANINAVMASTGMGESAASSVYYDASNYAMVLDDHSLADEIAKKAAYANTSISGIEIKLPTLEIVTDSSTFTIGIEADGTAWNDGAEFIRISSGKSVSATLGGTVELTSVR